MKYTRTTTIFLMAHLRQLFLYVITPLLLSDTSYASELRFSNLGKSDGLSQGTVTALVQDDFGFIWIGTEDGLARYDGSQLEIFRNDPDNQDTVQDNVITDLSYDSNGKLWITTESDGVSYYDYQSASFVMLEPDTIGMSIEHIFHATQSALILILSENGLFSINADNNIARLLPPQQIGSVIFAYEDNNHIRVILNSGELITISLADKSTSTSSLLDAEIIQAWSLGSCKLLLQAIVPDNNGRSALYCHDNLFTKKSIIETALRNSDLDTTNLSISDIKEQDDGALWIASSIGLINVNNGELGISKHQPHDHLSLSSNNLTKLSLGKNTLFIGTKYDGLNMLNIAETPFTYHDLLNSSKKISNTSRLQERSESCGQLTRGEYDTVWSILNASNGDLWVGNDAGLAMRKQDSDYFVDMSHIGNKPDNSIDLCSVWSLAESDNFIWIGIWGGLISLDKSSGSARHYKPQINQLEANAKTLSGRFVRLLLYDEVRNSLWIGTNANGLNRLDLSSDKVVHYPYSTTNEELLPHGRIRSLYLGPDNQLWVGTGGGLSLWNETNNTFRTLTASSVSTDLSDEDVRAINHYKDDYYWIGTGNGINLFNAKSFLVEARLNEKNGLPNSTVYAMIPDTTGKYWITTANGLSRFDPEMQTFINYTYHHGLQSNEFNFNAWAKGNNENIFVGGVKGLNVISTNNVTTDNDSFDPVLTSITGIDSQGERLIVSLFPDENIKQSVPSSFRNLEFKYALPAFNGIDDQTSQYKLTASSTSWSEPVPGSNTAIYTNVKKGLHYFQLKRTTDHDVFKQYSIYMNPTLSEKIWFRGLLVCIFFGLLTFLFVYYNKRRIESSLDALALQHYYILEHELKPHLHQANSNLSTLLKFQSMGKVEKEYIVKAISPLLEKSVRFLSGTKELADFTASTTRPKYTYMLEDVVDEVLLYFNSYQERIIFSKFDDLNIYTHEDAAYLLLTNLISNAIKYSPDDDTVSVKIITDGYNLTIECADKGHGIRLDRRHEIYKPYQRLTDNNNTIPGLGLGLTIVKLITHTYNGTISIQDNEPKGTRFTVTLKGVVTDEQ